MAGIERPTLADVDFGIEKRDLDTVLVAFTDLQGRLVGRRLAPAHFLGEAVPSGVRMPAHLLTTDARQAAAPGYELASTASGLGDMVLRIDPATLFRMPWQPGAVGVMGDLELPDGSPVEVAPRMILKRQAKRLETSSLAAALGAEPQFTAFEEPAVPARRLRGEQLARQLRLALAQVPIAIEGTVALAAPGHYEVTLRPDGILAVCDGLVVLRSAIADIAEASGMTATSMASYGAGAASACHLSLSLRGLRGSSTLSDRNGEGGLSEVGKAFVAGQLAHAAELCLLYAPGINSYRRFGADPVSPTAANWGVDNRTCAIRVVGTDPTLRVENRLPGSDANPYLATAAMIAAGLDGINRQLPLSPPVTGDGRLSGAPALPAGLDEALAAWSGSDWVRGAFGAEVQAHYANMARVELDAAHADGHGAGDDSVEAWTWERARYFAGS